MARRRYGITFCGKTKTLMRLARNFERAIEAVQEGTVNGEA